MRITNSIMMNNSMNNINKNKVLMDKLFTQISTTKKLQKPSDDPIAAIRALRLRSTEAEINQYLEKNVEDAESWMTNTEEALNNLEDMIAKIDEYYNQGVSEYNTVKDREAIITSLKQFKDQLYSDGNADNAGRTIFTGYRTDSSLTFLKDVADEYEMTQNLTLSDIRAVNKVVGVDIESTNDYKETDVTNNDLHVIMLAYDNLDSTKGLSLSSSTNDMLDNAQITVRSYQELKDAAYNVQDDEIVFIPETGELIFGNNYFNNMNSTDEFSVTYTKTGFKEGELRPENYFYCENKTTGITYGTIDENGKKYIEDQKITYNINFNQSIVINVEGKDVLKHSLARDLDITIAAAEATVNAHNKVSDIENKIEVATAAGNTAEVERLNNMKKAAELEAAYAEDNLTKSFSRGITLYQNHLSEVSTKTSDIGSRMVRLSLNKERLEAQLLTVKDLKSVNEDADVEAVSVEFKEAQSIYDASLLVAAQIVQKSLLDYL